MKMRDILFVVGILAVVAILYILSVTGAKPPAIPPDVEHAAARTVGECKVCHSADGPSPLKKEHPPKDQCFGCHKVKPGGGHGVVK